MNQEIIEKVKLRGNLLRNEICPLLNDRYGEFNLFEYNDSYYVIQTILDNYDEVCYYEDGEDFRDEKKAQIRFDEIIEQNQLLQDES